MHAMCFFSMLCMLGSRSICEFYCPLQEQGCLAALIYMCVCVCVFAYVLCPIDANMSLCVSNIVCRQLDIYVLYIYIYNKFSQCPLAFNLVHCARVCVITFRGWLCGNTILCRGAEHEFQRLYYVTIIWFLTTNSLQLKHLLLDFIRKYTPCVQG